LAENKSKKHWILVIDVRNAWTFQPVKGLCVEVLNPKDSAIVDTMEDTGQENGGQYSIDLKNYGNYLLRLRGTHYNEKIVPVKVYKYNTYAYQSKPIEIVPKVTGFTKTLNAATVKASRVKMVMHGDTIVYDARAFQTAEGSMLEELIEELPGVKLNESGQITVNGKFVSSLLVNGKDFFRGDPHVALENLPAYMVDKVKSYERDIPGHQAVEDQKETVMDVILKKEYSRSYVGNADVAMGTHDRYSGRVFGLKFSDRTRMAIYSSMNNVNSSRRPGRDGNWNPTESSSGLTSMKEAGWMYSYNDNKKLSLDLESRFSYHDTDIKEESSSETYLTSGTSYTRSQQVGRNKPKDWNANAHIGYKISKEINSFLNPSVSYGSLDNIGSLLSASFNNRPDSVYTAENIGWWFPQERLLKNAAVNSHSREILGNGYRFNVNAPFILWIDMTRIPLNFSIEDDFSYSRSNKKEYSLNDYAYYQTERRDYRNEYESSPVHSISNKFEFCPNYVVTSNDKMHFIQFLYYRLNYERRNSDYSHFRLDSLKSWNQPLGILPSDEDSMQMAFDRENSRYSIYENRTHEAEFYEQLQLYDVFGKKGNQFDIRLHLPVQLSHDQMKYCRARMDTTLMRNNIFFIPDVKLKYQSNSWGEVDLSFVENAIAPSQLQLIDVVTNTDPQNIYRGNPLLKTTYTHTSSFSFTRANNRVHRIVWSSLKWMVIQSAVCQSMRYNEETGVRSYSPKNMDGNWNMNGHLGISQGFGKDTKFSMNEDLDYTYSNNVDEVGDHVASERSTVHWSSLDESLKANYCVDKWNAGVKIGMNWLNGTSRRESFERVNSYNWVFGGNGQIELPFSMELSTDFNVYLRRGYSDASMNTTEYVWNARISKKFLKGKQASVALDGFDILHNLSNVRRVMDAQGRTETRQNVLPNYLLLHFIYHFSLPGKKKG
jgi:hypothetical protein